MKKKVLTGMLILFVVVALSSFALAETVEITVLHTNDTHSRVEEDKYAGMGFARLATLIKEERAANENVLLLDAGDSFHGQTIANLVKGESIVRIMNLLDYDLMTAGNHDFNYGKERLLELNEMTEFPILAANVTYEDGTEYLKPYVIKEVAGVKLGIFGLATPETLYKTHPKNVEGLVFADPVETAREMVAELEGRTDVIIALSHLGISSGSEDTSELVASQVEGIDLIVDGHSHDVLEEGKLVGDTLIVMAGEYDKYLGRTVLTVEDGKVSGIKAELISKEEAAEVEPDPEVLQLVEEIKGEIEKITSVVIGEAAVELVGERGQVRTGETNLGNLIADVMLRATSADLAITNGGGIRASIDRGEITKGEVITVLPFGNFVVAKELSGAKVLDAVEHGISAYPATEGLFPQVAGMSFVFDPGRPAGERVLELKVNGEPIDYSRTYRIATNDFMAAGGDGYTMFQEGEVVQEAGGLEEEVMKYIQEVGVVSPKVEGRIIPVEKSGDNYSYEIKSGDTLHIIASKFGVEVRNLIKLNELEDPDLIIAGQKLLIPAE